MFCCYAFARTSFLCLGGKEKKQKKAPSTASLIGCSDFLRWALVGKVRFARIQIVSNKKRDVKGKLIDFLFGHTLLYFFEHGRGKIKGHYGAPVMFVQFLLHFREVSKHVLHRNFFGFTR